MARKEHNWNQIHRVLLRLGFKQVSETPYNDKLFYQRGDDEEVMLYKSNKMDKALIEAIAENLGMTYDDFVSIYKQDYLTSLRR
jgi:hypothetical protein